jgi:hypothetical protein
LNRGVITALLACRELKMSVGGFVARVYAKPLLLGASVFAGLWALKHQGLVRGQNPGEILAAGAAMAAVYMTGSYFVCLSGEHREMVVRKVRGFVKRRS